MQTARDDMDDIQGTETELNDVNLTHHARARSTQRGINSEVIGFILAHGSQERKPGGAMEIRINKRVKTRMVADLKRRLRVIERAAGKAVLMADDGVIITVYNKL
jgi:hypothetical protein